VVSNRIRMKFGKLFFK